MARRSAKPDQLTIKGLSAEDQAWLKDESDRLGCDPENLVRMMIRQRMMPRGPQPPDGGGERFEWRTGVQPMYGHYADPGYQEQAPSDPEPTLNEAEPSLDALMAAVPTFLDKPPDRPPIPLPPPPKSRTGARLTPFDPIAEQRSGRGMRFSRPANVVRFRAEPQYPLGAFSAFTETEFVGVNNATIGANSMGDARGNVMRDNLRHFGVVGTRSR